MKSPSVKKQDAKELAVVLKDASTPTVERPVVLGEEFYIALHGDTHGGHKLGLLSPHSMLLDMDGYGHLKPWYPARNTLTDQIYEWYSDDILWVRNKIEDKPLVVFHNGDPTQGQKYPREWVSTRAADQVFIAEENMAPWFDIPSLRAFRFTKGTGSHELGEGSSTLLIARLLQYRFREADIGVSYHYLVNLGGVMVDVAHHGTSPGIRDWTEANVLRLYTMDLMKRDIKKGHAPPQLVVRSHYHTMAWATVNERMGTEFYRCESVILPGYCGIDDYARKVTGSKSEVHIGLVLVHVKDGLIVEVLPHFRILDMRTKEVIT